MRKVRDIDRGGFGYVEEVEDSNGDRFAKKIFDPQFSGIDRSLLRRRFEREVRIQSAINHPNIMPIIDSELSLDPPWFLMPLASESFNHKINQDHSAGDFDTSP